MQIGWESMQPTEDAVSALYDRLEQTAEMMRIFYQEVQNATNNSVVNAHISITHRDQDTLVRDRLSWGVNATHTMFGFVERFIRSADKALENLSNSDGDLDLDELVWNITLIINRNIIMGTGAIRTRQNAILRGGRNIGLIQDMTPSSGSTKDCCGWICLLQALMSRSVLRDAWDGDLRWLLEYVKDEQHPLNKLRGQKIKRILVDKLKEQLGMTEDQWILQPGHGANADTGTVHRIVKKQPGIQIVIFNEANKALNDRQTGRNWKWSRGDTATVYLSLDIDFKLKSMGHLRLIRTPVTFFAHAQLGYDTFYCDRCLRVHNTSSTCLAKTYQCDACGLQHEDNQALNLHMTVEGFGRKQCDKCLNKFYNQSCLSLHRCPARYLKRCTICLKKDTPNHPCLNEYICKVCKTTVILPSIENPKVPKHECYIQRPEKPGIVPDIPLEQYGSQYYAFDTESEMHVDSAGRSLMKHVVNFVHVKQCFTDNQWDFDTLEDFMTWVMKINQPSTFFAHNLKGYDGRLVWECTQKTNLGLESCAWRGSQILQMKCGLITFADSLLHFPQALDQLPKSLNMDQSQFKKGFFPYKFCTVQNRNYIGTIPDIQYYEPDKMKVGKREEFLEWYAEQKLNDNVYNLREEMKTYCQSDVKILKKAIETYLQVQIIKKPLDPWKSMTMASYALQMYRQYYMPLNQIGILDSKITSMLKPSMHGGRTDVRCLIKEWSDDEINQGYYGRYQDVQSLYPTVQFYDDMPIGQPEITYYVQDQQLPDLNDFFGFVCCDIKSAKYLHHPIIVKFDPVKKLLLADLNDKVEITIPSPELHLALQNGYVVTRVYWTMKFRASKELFKDYFRDFLKDKLESSGVPQWIQSEDDWCEFRQYHIDNLGITLERENMIKNNSRKTGAKLLCNSLWGKFGETQKPTSYKQFHVGINDDEYMAMISRRGDGEIFIKKMFCSDNKMKITAIYQESGDDYSLARLRRINLAIASMVTSHARCRLWQELNKLGDRVLYHDTDSIVYENSPNGYNIPVGRYLGEWECETDGLPITRFVSTGPKSYSYTVRQQDGTFKNLTKAKGIQASYVNMSKIGYEQMKSLVLKNIEKYQTNNLLFKYEQRKGSKEGQMSTGELIKNFRVTYAKGLIDPENMKVYPFGCKQFLPDDISNRLCLWHDINVNL